MKRKYTHHHGKLFWQILLTDAYRPLPHNDSHPQMVDLVVKSNAPTFKGTIYPKLSLEEAQVFVAWIERLPVHQFRLATRSIIQGFNPGVSWAVNFERGQQIYNAMQGQHEQRNPEPL